MEVSSKDPAAHVDDSQVYPDLVKVQTVPWLTNPPELQLVSEVDAPDSTVTYDSGRNVRGSCHVCGVSGTAKSGSSALSCALKDKLW